MTRKAITIVVAVALLISILAGCVAPAPTAPAVEPAANAAAAPEAASAAEPVTIKFALWDYDLWAFDKAIVENCMEKHPNIKVEVVSIPNADYDNKINIMLSGGEDLDVLYAKSTLLFGNMIAKDQLYDLKPLLTRDNIDLEPYGASVGSFMTMGDKIFGLPYRYDRYLLYYNKDLFDAAGEPYPGPDMTWDDYRALAMKMTKGEGASKTYGAFFGPFNFFFLAPGLQEGQGDYSTIDYSLFKEGWSNFYNMMYTDKSAQDWPSLKSVSADQTYFEKGNAAMTINGTWYMMVMKTDIEAGKTNIRWGAQRVPVSQAMKAAGVHASQATITPVVMNAKTKNPEAAWTLIKCIASEESGKIMAAHLITPGFYSPAVVDAMAEVEGFDPSAKDAILNSGAAYPAVSGANKSAGALSTLMNQQIELLFTQNQDLDTTIAELTRQRAEILAESK